MYIFLAFLYILKYLKCIYNKFNKYYYYFFLFFAQVLEWSRRLETYPTCVVYVNA